MDIDYSLHYSKWHGESDEYFAASAQFHRQLLAPILLNINCGAQILDIGCGTGLLVNALQQTGFQQVSGIDISPQQIAVALKRGLPCRLVDEHYLANEARIAPNSLDVVFLLDVLEHLEVDKQLPLLSSVHALLRPGGGMVVSVPNANSTFAMRWRHVDWTHHASFTEHSLEFVVRNAGFETISYFPYEFGVKPTFPYIHRLSFWTWVLRKFVRLFRRLEAVGELGREGLRIPLGLNLLGVAKKAE
jgi:SAM-dependent methyltransferase